MHLSFWSFFTDPILRGPHVGTMLMAISAALVGVLAYVRRRCLLGEALSHASYPGVIVAIVLASVWFPGAELAKAIAVLIGALISSLLGLWAIEWLVQRVCVRQDSALCLVLSLFFGVGITLASRVQFTHPVVYRQVEMYLYGQAATMQDRDILFYGLLCLVVIVVVLCVYKEVQVSSFDRLFAESIGLRIKLFDSIIFLLVAVAVVMGIRSVGVILMSAMLVAPPLTARQYTHRLHVMFVLSALFAALSSLIGSLLSFWGGMALATAYPQQRLSLPTGPMIVLSSALLCLLSLLFAPSQGLILRLLRIGAFRYRSLQENLLKAIWREGRALSLASIAEGQSVSRSYLAVVLTHMVAMGWLTRQERSYSLTPDGERRAARIIRRHRLWELYLVTHIGVKPEAVHRSAEEAEHVITPEMEAELAHLLDHPREDPHRQPIPPRNATQ